MSFINIAFYYFFKPSGSLEAFRDELKQFCDERRLLGTILLAPEGINLMVSGTRSDIEAFKSRLTEILGKKDLFFKESVSQRQPFNRMLVKIKPQLIPVDRPGVQPDMNDATHLDPETLKAWYDSGRDFIILDTRNEFEYRIGTFQNAEHLNIASFRDFDKQLEKCPQEWKQKDIVTFCTGGIRCEKAVPILKDFGFKNVFQLHGGILNYFEKIGGKYYDGDCFVFDQRVAVTPSLEQADVIECSVCRHPLTSAEQKLPSYEAGISCPYCESAGDPR